MQSQLIPPRLRPHRRLHPTAQQPVSVLLKRRLETDEVDGDVFYPVCEEGWRRWRKTRRMSQGREKEGWK